MAASIPSNARARSRPDGREKVKSSAYRPWKARWYALIALLLAVVMLVFLPLQWHLAPDADDAATLRLLMFAGSLATLATTMLAIGVGVTGQRMGVLWNARNSYSLSRLQICMWTLLILSALMTVVACRAHGLFVATDSSGIDGALNIAIPNELLWVMGISVASAAAAPAILSVKAQGETPSGRQIFDAEKRLGSHIDTVGQVVIRDRDSDPMVKDFFQGDEVSKAGTVDIGKLQQGVITFILWTIYFGILIRMIYTGDASNTSEAMTQLPKMSDSFVYLLGISHAGYLAYKAAPAASGAEVRGGSLPSSGIATVRPAPPSIS